MPANATCSSLDGLPWRPDRRRLAWGVRPALVGADDAPLCRQMMPLLGGALVIHGAMFSWTRYAQDQMRVGGDRDIPLAVPIGQVMFAGSGASSLISPTLAKHPNHRSKFQLRPNVFSALLTALQTWPLFLACGKPKILLLGFPHIPGGHDLGHTFPPGDSSPCVSRQLLKLYETSMPLLSIEGKLHRQRLLLYAFTCLRPVLI